MRLIGLREIAQLTSYKESSVRKIVAQPDFPAPIRLWERADPRWPEDEVIEWLRMRRDAA